MLGGTSQPLFGEPLRLIRGLENPFLPYLSFLFLIAIPFFLKSKGALREWTISAILSLCYLLFIALQYPEAGAQYLPPQGSTLFAVPVFLILISLKAMYRQPLQIAIIFTFIAIIPYYHPVNQLSFCRAAFYYFSPYFSSFRLLPEDLDFLKRRH